MDVSPELVESVSRLSFSEGMNRRIQNLITRNSDGQLSKGEREELASLVEMSESIAIVRVEALRLLGRRH